MRWLRIGSRIETALFWAVMAIFVAAIFLTRLLPFTDYPAHLALAGILSRIWAGDPTARELYDTNLLSYNSLFHVIVAALARVMPIATAGRVVVCSYLVGLPLVVLALLRALGRPPWRVFFVATFLVGFPVNWGFFNYCYGLLFGLWVVVRVVRDERPTWRAMAFTALLCWLGAFAHLFATLICAAIAGAALLGRALAQPRGFALRALSAVRSLLPFLPALAYCAYTYLKQEKGPVTYDDFAYLNGHDVPSRWKVLDLLTIGVRAREDALDAKVALAAILVLGLALPFRAMRARRGTEAVAWAMFGAAAAFYIFLPDTMWSTAKVYERVSIFVFVTGVVAIPLPNAIVARIERVVLPSCAIASAALFFQARLQQRTIYADLERVIDEAPKHRRLISLLRDVEIEGWSPNALGHVGSYYVARAGGESAVHFAKYMSLPVHYRPDKKPPLAPDQLAWNGATIYDPTAEYARYFDLVLWRAWDDAPNDDPRSTVWGPAADSIEVLSHHGEWWLLDAAAFERVRRAQVAPPLPVPVPVPVPVPEPPTDWCEPGLHALDAETCYVLPPPGTQPTRLVVYLHGIVPPLPKSEQKTKVENVVLESATRAGAAALVPRGIRGVGPEGAKDWWAWPTSADVHARESKAIITKWANAKKKLEAIAGVTFARTYLAGSSNGAYYLAALALSGELADVGFQVDGYGAMSGGATGGRPAAGAAKPFYVGWGAYDDTNSGAKALVKSLEAAGWPTLGREHPFGHGARTVYLDEAFTFWDAH